MAHEILQPAAAEWVSFPGGELEGQRPTTLCAACREALAHAAAGVGSDPAAARRGRTLCFQCYRAGLERDRAIRAAGTLDTASEARFQYQLPLEPINTGRLATLKTERAESRAAVRGIMVNGVERFADKRRRAQIAARHALQTIASGLARTRGERADRDRAFAMAIHAAELQLPDSWMPFVVSR
jgi:hypothetical protein